MRSRSNWNLEVLVSEERGKPEYREKKPFGARERTNNKLSPHMALTPGFERGPHWWEASALTTAPPLLPGREASHSEARWTIVSPCSFIFPSPLSVEDTKRSVRWREEHSCLIGVAIFWGTCLSLWVGSTWRKQDHSELCSTFGNSPAFADIFDFVKDLNPGVISRLNLESWFTLTYNKRQ